MAALSRVRLTWTGAAVVGASTSTFFTTGDPGTLMGAFDDVVDAMKANLPDSLSAAFEGSGEIIESTTGLATGAWTETPPVPVVGTDSGGFAQGVGERIAWSTNAFENGRRVRGSTFIVPLGAGAYTDGGILNATMRAAHNAAVATFLGVMAGDMVIYSRPSPGGSDGGFASVTGGNIPPSISWLRSRRT